MQLKTIYSIASASLLAAVLIGCGSGAGGGYTPKPVPKVAEFKLNPGDEKTLFPLVKDNQWVYASNIIVQQGQQQATNNVELTFVVKNVVDVGNGKKATIEISSEGKVTERQAWLVNDKGIYQVTAGKDSTVFDPIQPAVAFPPEAGREFKWEGKGLIPGGSYGVSRSVGKVLGPQEVDTDLGRMSALAVENTQTWTLNGKRGEARSTVWWAPKIGIVRFVQEIATDQIQARQTLKLKSKSIKE